MTACPNCGAPGTYVQQYQREFCNQCNQYLPNAPAPPAPPAGAPAPPSPAAPMPAVDPIWTQNHYKIKKKVLTIWNKYWIEDANGRVLGFSKQKMFKLKEDIRVYKDENMTAELFAIKQTQIFDMWGTFAVIDTMTGATLGALRRKGLKSAFLPDEWEMYDAQNRLIGGLYESTGRGLARKYVPGGALIPEKMQFTLNGQPVANINQKFKIIGDIWEMDCLHVPAYVDRRVMLAALLLMGMIERDRK